MTSSTPAQTTQSPPPSTPSQYLPNDSEYLTEEQKPKMTRGKLQYRTDVTFNPYELPGLFWIIFFLGPPPSDKGVWLFGPNTVGVLSPYTDIRPQAPPGVKDAQQGMHRESKWRGGVELNRELLKKTRLVESDLEFFPRDVVSYLKENLNWRVIMASPPHSSSE